MSNSVYDCFLFFNELDLLEIKLSILKNIVDKFVIVEADRTFSNTEKPFYFELNKLRYSEFLHKIIYIKITEYPEIKSTWDMETYQRNQIACGLKECSPDDIIIISDLDEITNPDIIGNYTEKGIYNLKQLHFDYYFNYQRIGINKFWYRAKILHYSDITDYNLTPQNIRSFKTHKIIKNAGWHFSFLGGIDSITYKIQSFSHQEWNNNKYINNQIDYKIKNGMDLFNRKNRRLIPVKLKKNKFPGYIIDNKEKYSKYIYLEFNYFVIIKNLLYCFPYTIKNSIITALKIILPKKIIFILKKLNSKEKE